MNFSEALDQLKDGNRVCRSGWNGKGMYIFIVNDWDARSGLNIPTLPFIAIKTAQDSVVPWLASQTDILADDWELVE